MFSGVSMAGASLWESLRQSRECFGDELRGLNVENPREFDDHGQRWATQPALKETRYLPIIFDD